MIETVRLIAAGLATAFFLWAALSPQREDMDRFMDDLKRVGRLNSIGAFFAAVVFACEVAIHVWPNL